MTFVAQETSVETGSPVELYTITHGSDTFHYTTSEETLILGTDTFTAIEISRDDILVGPQSRTQTITIELKSNNEFAARFIGVQPSDKATVTIERFHRFDSADPDQRVEFFKGQVRSVAFIGDGFKSKLSVMPLTGALSQTIPLFTFQSPCNNVLFDSRCKVLKANFNFVGTVTAVSADGRTLTVPGLDAAKGVGFATAGQIEITTTGDPRDILTHSATDQVKILLPFRETILDVGVTVFSGCGHAIADCKDDFDNVVNFQGHAFVPLRNIFSSGLD